MIFSKIVWWLGAISYFFKLRGTASTRCLSCCRLLDSAVRIARLLVLGNTAVNGSEIVRSSKELACQTTKYRNLHI